MNDFSANVSYISGGCLNVHLGWKILLYNLLRVALVRQFSNSCTNIFSFFLDENYLLFTFNLCNFCISGNCNGLVCDHHEETKGCDCTYCEVFGAVKKKTLEISLFD